MNRKHRLAGVASAALALVLAIVMATLSACGSSSSPATSASPSGSAQPAASASAPASSAPASAPASSPGAQPASGAPYKVGLTGALTGPAAPAYQLLAEGMRVYFAYLNAKGGIDGHPVQAQFEDDHGDPGAATTNFQKFISQGANLLVNDTSSNTYAPTFAEAKRANLPVVTLGVAPPQVLGPKPDPLIFAIAQTAAAKIAGPRLLFNAQKLLNNAPIKAAFVTVDIPGSVSDTNFAISIAKQFNATVTMIKVPQNLADFSSVASEIIAGNYNLATAIGPAIGVSTYTALDKLGYKGTFIDFTSFEAEDLAKLKKDNLYISSPTGPLVASRPDFKQILDAAKQYQASGTTSRLAYGWAAGQTIAEVLKQTGWPVTTAKMLKVMDNFQLSHGQVFPPTRWTATDHEGPFFWRLYHWDASKQAIVTSTPWYSIAPSGDPKSIATVGDQLP